MPRLSLAVVAALLCALLAAPADAKGKGSTAKSPSAGAPKGNPKCSPEEQAIGVEIEQATGKKAADHVAKNFNPNGSYLVNDYVYNNFVKGKPKLGRPQGNHSYLFVAGSSFITGVLKAAKKPDGTTDFAVIEKKLGLPGGTYKPDGGLWRVDVSMKGACYRLPRANDPGANSDFKPGGFTSGGVPEILVIDGKAAKATNIVKVGAQAGKGSGSAKGKGSKGGSSAKGSKGGKKKGKGAQ